MPGRVLSTDEAKASIQRIQSIVNTGLADQITQLNNEGTKLSQPEVWDGPLAEQFRGDIWPSTKAALDKARQELDELQQKLQSIAQNIMAAGGA
ncbi:pyrophosphorylase [Actinoplanes sp. TRM 88003]|uniref:Pyrophosphorylase n=1 Tax=Paractinoplanes aksuensis TaxID=2939490 RepID=A0ABT1E3R3_9ACTN|nr:pyrophosphorylase [Actinoplanes aksuensis]MCO8277498.1 pyrophosphorylase [Actinoplanes aksuensis]